MAFGSLTIPVTVVRCCAFAAAMLFVVASPGPPVAAFEVIRVQEAEAVPGLSDEEFRERQTEVLNALFLRLRDAEDERSAQLIEQAVWQVWLQSGSETVDLLMQQSIKALNDEQQDAALGILDAIVELAPDYAEGWNKRATVLFLMQRFHESMRDIVRVLELEPRHFGALSGIGLIRRSLGDKQEALAAFRQALEIHPYLPGAREAIEELSEEVDGQGI
jgi:tetratricopeptide (TPR) repeat protein